MKAAVFHAVAPRQIFQSIRDSWIQGLHKFDGKLGLVGNDNLRQDCVETEICRLMLRASSGISVYSKMLALHHVQTAKQYIPRHPSTCIAKEHSSMLTKIFSGGMQLAH